MKVRLTIHPILRINGYEGDTEIEIPDTCTVRELHEYLGIDGTRHSRVAVIINDEPVWNSTVIKENDSVTLTVFAGGG